MSRTHRIAVIPGDGIGTEVVPQGLRVLDAAARAFEAQALGQMLQPIFATLQPGKSAFGGGMAEAQWQPMLVDAMAQSITRSGRGLGLADAVLKEMLRWQSAGAHTGEADQ